MAFEFYKGEIPVEKELEATSGVAYSVGDALVLTSGKAAKAGATAKPEFICACNRVANEGKPIVAQLIAPNMEFKTVIGVSGLESVPVVGTKLTLSNANSVTGTTASGVAEVVEASGKAQGDAIIVKF